MTVFMMLLALLLGNGHGRGNPHKPPLCPSGKPDTCDYVWPPQQPDEPPLT